MLRNPCSHSKIVYIQGFNLPYLITNSKVIDVLPALQKATQVCDNEPGYWNTKIIMCEGKIVKRIKQSQLCIFKEIVYIPDTDLTSIPDIFIALLNWFKFTPKTSFPQLPICVGICHKALCFLEITKIPNSLILLPSKSEPSNFKIEDKMKGQKSFFSKKTQVFT